MENLNEFKQKIRKVFLLFWECFLLLLAVICGPLWTGRPTGSFFADLVLWSLGFFLLIWATYAALQQARKQKFGKAAEPPRFWDVLFHLLTFLLGILFIGLAFFIQEWRTLAAPIVFGFIGAIAVLICGWELYKVGSRL
jgi:hypothetical protein